MGVFLIAFVGMGIGLVFDGLVDNFDTTLARLGVYETLLVGLGAVIGLGSVLALVGTTATKRISRAWALQATGHTLLVGGWSVYALTVVLLDARLIIAWGFPASAALASLAYLRLVLQEERVTRRTIEELDDVDAAR